MSMKLESWNFPYRAYEFFLFFPPLLLDFSMLIRYQAGIAYGRAIKVELFDNLVRTYGLLISPSCLFLLSGGIVQITRLHR